MNRIAPIDPTHATSPNAELFAAIKGKLGMVPNLMRTFAQSPAALQGYLAFGGALDHTSLSARIREQVALAVAEANGCDYCLSAHSLLGKGAGLAPEAIEAARRGESTDPKVRALLQLARAIVQTRGKISDEAFAAARAAGVNDQEIVETVALVGLNILTNYLNNVARTEIDFPRAKPLSGA